MRGQPKIAAGRLPLFGMIGFSVLLHGLFIMGLPNLPWFSHPPDILRLTRYVVRFAKPVPTSVPVLTQVAVAEPVAIEPAPIAPVADLQTPKPIERVETQPEHAVELLPAPALVQPVVPKPPDVQQRTAAQTQRRVETQPEHAIKPQATPAVVQPVVSKPPDVQQRTAAQTRQRVESPTEHVVKPQAAPTVVQPIVPRPPEIQQRTAAQTRRRVESPTEHVVKPQVAPAVVQPIVPKPPEVQQRTATRREHVVVQAHRQRPERRAVEPQPVVVRTIPERRAARAPRSSTATQTTGRQAPSRVAAAVPQTAAVVPTHVAALSQPRQPSREAIRQAERERLQAEQEQAELDAVEHYRGLIRQRLEAHSRYLQEVTERSGESGRVVLQFTVLSDGQVVDPRVTDAVGHRTFRSAALRVLKRVGQLPPLPSEIRRQQILIEVPISFQFQLEDR